MATLPIWIQCDLGEISSCCAAAECQGHLEIGACCQFGFQNVYDNIYIRYNIYIYGIIYIYIYI